jgi:hypothetical protein
VVGVYLQEELYIIDGWLLVFSVSMYVYVYVWSRV